MKKKKIIVFDYNYLEYSIKFKCKCGTLIYLDENTGMDGTECPKCKRRWDFQIIGKVVEVKKR